ncbi:MAG: response regulator [Defluviitaleaceae bacterium]|nr:response regulator [Defluviitaleaceae bacterium]
MKILIVDDVAVIRTIIKDILANYCNIDKKGIFDANSGTSAIKKYPKVQPDVVFLDIHMPDIDGVSVVKEIKSMDSSAKVIMCTSSGDLNYIKQCVAAGATGYILKPPTPENVKKAIETAMGIDLDVYTGNTDKLQKELEELESALEAKKRALDEATQNHDNHDDHDAVIEMFVETNQEGSDTP